MNDRSISEDVFVIGMTSAKVVMAFILVFLVSGTTVFAQLAKVYNFDIDGLKLNMNLDEVIKEYGITNIKVIKGAHGFISGYEIRKRIEEQKVILVLNFTGEKMLYRAHYRKLDEKYKYRPQDLLQELIKKYGKPWVTNAEVRNQKTRNIYACWGSSCKKYPRTTPILTANIDHLGVRLRLMLSDNRIFNRDWKKHKQKVNGQKALKEGGNSQ
ncbi:hypothetical protein KKI24_14760 [bacterium]|nr:hypothetical protein [bacterium]